MKPGNSGISAHLDERGTLVAVELAEVPFDVRRLFVVVAPGHSARRGGHTVGCRELLVLVSGSVTVSIADAMTRQVLRSIRLSEPGESVLLLPNDFIDYVLDTPESSIVVLADSAFVPRENSNASMEHLPDEK
jgi:hypothetical protein